MTHKGPSTTLLLLTLFLTASAVASTTWYVNGVSGSNTNSCLSATTPCKSIQRAISLAASGDSILVAVTTYKEHLTIGRSLTIAGSGGSPVVDGGSVNTVVTVSNTSAHVTLSRLTISHGAPTGSVAGGGIINRGILRLNGVHITGNRACAGGGIYNTGVLVINTSTISGNGAHQVNLCSFGAGIANTGTLTLNRSTISGNTVSGTSGTTGYAFGGGIYNSDSGTLTINNSTITGNVATAGTGTSISPRGGGIYNSTSGKLAVNNSTISRNGARVGGNVYGPVTLQNSIVANSVTGGNCLGAVASHGYNLSSDSTCKLNSTGDMINTDPILGSLQNNGGPTQTMALPQGSPAVDAGNPSGCTDSLGHLLKTDQRGKPRPDAEDTAGCDIGAYEYQGAPLPVGHCVFVCGSTRCGMLTGYCIGSVNGACRKTFEPTQCPVGKPAGGFGSSCGQSIDTTRTCTP